MNDEPEFIAAALRDLLASTAVILAAWGALGGATNALTTKMRLRDAIRHILLGGLIAAGWAASRWPSSRAGSTCRLRRWLWAGPRARPPTWSASSDPHSLKSHSPACAAARGATAMHELLRLARQLRCDPASPSEAFGHRLRVGFAIAVLILLVSL